ncbi:MAG: MFS transporter [Saccharopolyspora sp.]|uniref:MFS transporter n=1 Tax=Saccharopolyspora sp. TaxID=33915 RepID=UPI0025E7F8E1|nr:MFS transporter [Saccharopolyspora sp.]MBQ6642330.1 MFS transporter [Saccharopolyspora sp.]
MTTPNQSAPTLDADRQRRIALLALCLAGFVIQLDVTIINVAVPTIQHEFHATTGVLEWIISGYALGLAALIPLMGALGDRLGHRCVLLAGLIVFGLCSAAAALAPKPEVLIGARVGQGVGGAAILALTLAVLADTYPPEQRGHAIGWWAAIGGIGFGAGPVVGGLILSVFGWSTIFWVNVPIILATVALILLTVPIAAATSQPRPLDVPGVVLASAGLASVTFGLITVTDVPWDAARTLVPLGVGGLALTAFMQWQRRADDPLVPRDVRDNSAFIGACAIYFLSYVAFSGTLYYVTLMFQNLLGWSALRTGLSWLLMNIPFLLAAQMAGKLGQRFTPRAIVTTGCAGGAVGVAALSTLTPTTPFAVAGVGYLVSGVGFGLLVPGITSVAMRDVARPVAGAASAMLNSSRQLGTAVGLALVGALGAAATQHSWGSSRHRATHTITTGNLHGVPPRLQATASNSFEIGYHVALGICVVSLLVAVWLSVHVFKQCKAPTEAADAEEPSP